MMWLRGCCIVKLRVKVPLHVSGFWIPNYSLCPLITGSVGAGLLLRPALNAAALASGDEALINNRKVPEELVMTIKRLIPVNGVDLKARSAVELGEGYGLSAAILISLALSAMMRMGVRADLIKASRIAHLAEVLCGTGLGDVIAEVEGSELVVRVKPGPPGIGEVFNVRIKDSVAIETVRVGRLTTPVMLRDLAEPITKYGRIAMSRFMRRPGLEEFLESSRLFSRLTGMLSADMELRIKELLKNLISSGCVIGYYVKKSLLTVVSGSECAEEVINKLSSIGEVKLLYPSKTPASVSTDE